MDDNKGKYSICAYIFRYDKKKEYSKTRNSNRLRFNQYSQQQQQQQGKRSTIQET